MAVFFVLIVTAKSAFAFLRLNDLLAVLAAMQQILMQTASVHYHLQLVKRAADYTPLFRSGQQGTILPPPR